MSKNWKRLLTLFKKSRDEAHPPYPEALTRKYKISHHVLGTGSFGVVRLCKHRTTHQEYAVKVMLKKAFAGKEYMLDTEIDILKQIRHPHIISMHGLYEDKEAVYIVTDLAKGGELLVQLYNRGHYTETDAAKLAKQMLQGIAYLHEHDIVHRDLKPENLLLQSNEPDSPLLISDFGMSRILKDHDDIMTTACGTPGYVAPEVLLREGYGTAADLWSAGVIVYTLLCGYTPFYGADMAALIESVISGQYEFDDEYWKDISDSAKDFINGLLTYDPAKRLTAEAALQHAWLSSSSPSTHNLLASITRGRQNSLSSSRSFVSALADPIEHRSRRKSSNACAHQESTENKVPGRMNSANHNNANRMTPS